MRFTRRSVTYAAVTLSAAAALAFWVGQSYLPLPLIPLTDTTDRTLTDTTNRTSALPGPPERGQCPAAPSETQPTGPASTSPTTTTRRSPVHTQLGIEHDYAGYRDVYDIYVGNVDRSQPVGALFFFTGDVDFETDAAYHDDDFTDEMTRIAADHNLAFIAVHTPTSPTDPLDYFNWWDTSAKGDFARDLVACALDTFDIDRKQIWVTGYSGGAEMVMSELLAHDVNWLRGGGAIVMGGGEAVSGVEPPPNSAIANLQLLWVVGEDDGAIIPEESDWSARYAAAEGYRAYVEAGFRRAQLQLLPDQDHSYDIAAVIDTGLATLDPVTPH